MVSIFTVQVAAVDSHILCISRTTSTDNNNHSAENTRADAAFSGYRPPDMINAAII
jgi:hypothetical protein